MSIPILQYVSYTEIFGGFSWEKSLLNHKYEGGRFHEGSCACGHKEQLASNLFFIKNNIEITVIGGFYTKCVDCGKESLPEEINETVQKAVAEQQKLYPEKDSLFIDLLAWQIVEA